jgi:hypothetical protein
MPEQFTIRLSPTSSRWLRFLAAESELTPEAYIATTVVQTMHSEFGQFDSAYDVHEARDMADAEKFNKPKPRRSKRT